MVTLLNPNNDVSNKMQDTIFLFYDKKTDYIHNVKIRILLKQTNLY